MHSIWKSVVPTLFFCAFLVSGKKGVLVPRFSLKPPVILDSLGYRTIYACEGRTLQIICNTGVIHLIRANYGRFSISICNENGNLEWRVNCMSHHSFLIMQERCSLKTNCSVNVSSNTFFDPCPGTLKYLEVQYHCGTEMPLLTTPPSGHSSLLKVILSANTTVSHNPNKTQTPLYLSPSTASVMPTVPTLPLTRSTASTLNFIPTSQINVKKNEILIEDSTIGGIETIHPKISFEVSKTTTPVITSAYSIESYCPPMFSRGINWTWTKAGEIAILKCPDGASGMAKWLCNAVEVKWTPNFPDLQNCHSLWLENIKERIENGESVVSITSEIALMTSAKPLFSEDLKIIGDVIRQALYKSIISMENFLDTWHRYRVLREMLQSSVQTLSNLLDTKQHAAWNDLPLQERKMVISLLLQGLEESALLLAETSSDDGSFTLVKSNVILSLQVRKSKNMRNLIFPLHEDIISETDGIHWYNIQDSLLLPQQAIEGYSRNGLIKVIFTAFNNLNDFLIPRSNIFHYAQDHLPENITRIVNSRMIGASLERSGNSKLLYPVIVTLKHLIEGNATNPVCVYWDYHLRDWSAQGCWVESTNRSHTVCFCDHLTNFAVLMEVQNEMVSMADLEILYLVITIGCIIAIICLVLTISILYMLSFDLSGDSVFIHRNMFICLLLSEVLFVSGFKQTEYHFACALIAGLMQYLFLVTFAWVFVECFHQYIMMVSSCEAKRGQICCYYLSAYVIPGIITAISAIIDPSSYGTQNSCWLQADNYFVFSFVGPAVSIMFGGFVFLCIAFCILTHKTSFPSRIKGKDDANIDNYKYWNRRSLTLFIFMSLTWVFGLLFMNEESIFLAITFSVLNTIQGAIILALYCFQNEKVKQELKKMLRNNLCFDQQKENPNNQQSLQTTNATADHISQKFWNLANEKNSSIKTIDRSSNKSAKTLNDISNINQETKCALPRLNDRWQSNYSSKLFDAQKHTSTISLNYELSTQQPNKYRNLIVAPESNIQFLDHIYESIDDENCTNGQMCHRKFPLAENYDGDHSDLSQQSSSSCGYDQQPLLIEQNKLNSFQVPYGPSKYSTYQQHNEEIKPFWKQNPNKIAVDHKDPEDITNMHSSHSNVNKELLPTHLHSNDTPSSEPLESSLPDLLHCPVDSAVVLAVLDGDKVVNKLQNDDTLTQPQMKLSTYC